MTRKSPLIAVLFLAASAGAHDPPPGSGKAAGQLSAAQTSPDKTYENALSRAEVAAAVDARGAGGSRPALTIEPTPTRAPEHIPSVQREDRAVTTPAEKPSIWDSKWVSAAGNALLFGVLGFLAAGPWGALVGVLGGALVGWGLHGFFKK